jgi:hypothetical protein
MGLVAHNNARVIAMKPRSETSTPSPEKGTVRGRLPNAHYRTREYLTEKEIERLMKTAGDKRYGHRYGHRDDAARRGLEWMRRQYRAKGERPPF